MTAISDAQLPAPPEPHVAPEATEVNRRRRPAPAVRERPLMTSDEALSSNGIKQNRKGIFNITITGREAYEHLQLLEESAVEATPYVKARPFFLAAEVFREQLRQQGF